MTALYVPITQVSTVIQDASSPMARAAPSTTAKTVSGNRRRAASGSADSTTRPQGGEESGPSLRPPGRTGGLGGTGAPYSILDTCTGPSPG